MLKIFRAGAPGFETVESPAASWIMPHDTVWIELISPDRNEELCVEQALGVLLPTREEMAEIEASSRLYQEDGATFMTANVLYTADGERLTAGPVTFVLCGERLVTIRYFEPRAFNMFIAQASRQPSLCPTGAQTLLNLVDAIVDRTADLLEKTAQEVEQISTAIFTRKRTTRFDEVLSQLGRAQNDNAKIRDSLVSLARLISFAGLDDSIGEVKDTRDYLKTLGRDVQSLTDHASYVSGNVTFLLDAALGLINIEQNSIIKIFSVAAVAFLPPTLIASVYGMNFHHMPELSQPWGYPLAVGLMVLSAVVPLWWFRTRGWL
ncbi:MAG: magnesium/cobalt transporter CorA [Asticcacaulis sp.]